jgi:uncharacterized membrane protein
MHTKLALRRPMPSSAGRPLAVAIAAAMTLIPAFAIPTAAQEGLAITTPYPSVRVQPGSTASFDLDVSADVPVRVDLEVRGAPDGWTTTLRGGGREVVSVFAASGEPPELVLDVEIPDDASAGSQALTVVGTAGGESVSLRLDVVVEAQANGTVSLTTDVPSRQASADETFTFSLELDNDTPQQLTFDLSSTGPRGWTVALEPSGEPDATSVTIDARASKTLSLTATPPAQATEGQYPLRVDAVAGDQAAGIDLVAEVTGRIALEFTTADQRLNTTANAGSPTEVSVQVVNTGTSPLQGLSLSGTGPSDWDVTFDPETLDAVEPNGGVGSATARITPSGNAVAGDYVVTLRTSGEGVNEQLQIRVTVETAPVWGIVGIGLIVLTLAGMAWIFRRYGRR